MESIENKYWLNKLSPEQKDALLECFATGLLFGAKDIEEFYVFSESYLGNNYVHTFDTLTIRESKITLLQQALVAMLPTTGPDYEDVKTPEDFIGLVNEAYKLPMSERVNSGEVEKIAINKRFREMEAFKFNHQVMVDRGILDNYRRMIKFSTPDGCEPTQSTLNHWRFLLCGFSDMDEFYLKNEVLFTDTEIFELRYWGELAERAEQDIEDDDFYDPSVWDKKYDGWGFLNE